jgi:hypothetical protein
VETPPGGMPAILPMGSSIKPDRPPRLLAVAGAVLPLLAGCEDSVQLVVEVGLDNASCNTSDARQVDLLCPVTAGAWATDAEGGAIDQECISIRVGSLAGLREVFTGMDLNATRGDDVTVDVALFFEQPGDSCVHPDDLPADERPEVLMFGRGRNEELSGSRGPVEVRLTCTESPERSAGEECRGICLRAEDDCTLGRETERCDQEYRTCQLECDAACGQCTIAYDACLEGSPEAACQLAYQGCLDAGEETDNRCAFQYRECVEDGCGAEREACVDECPAPRCAEFPPHG